MSTRTKAWCPLPFTLILIEAFAVSPGEAATMEPYATRFCVERPGENGSVNTTPVSIRVDDDSELTINGETEVCLGINAANDSKLSVSLKFPYPYIDSKEHMQWWETPPVAVSTKAGKTTRLLLCLRDQDRNDAWVKKGWHDMWMLVSPAKRNLCAH